VAVLVAGTGVAIYVADGAKNDGLILMGFLLVVAAFPWQSERLSSIFFSRVAAVIKSRSRFSSSGLWMVPERGRLVFLRDPRSQRLRRNPVPQPACRGFS
jgi:hypothetical protein